MKKFAYIVIFLGLFTFSLATGCAGETDESGAPSPGKTDESGAPSPGEPPVDGSPPGVSSELASYVKKCERSAGEWRDAVVNYPERLGGGMGEELTYKAVVDIREEPPPPEEVIPYADESTAKPVMVRCRLAARLIAVSDTVDVRTDDSASEGGWRFQTWSPSGVVEWAWTVEPQAPGTQRLQLELTPAVDGGPEEFPNLNRVTYESTIDVRANVLARTWYWFQTDWNYVKGIAGAVGVALLAVLAFSARARDGIKGLLGK